MLLKDININELSPMMRHYVSVKEKYPNTLVFYRLGDFYELFFDDAIETSRALDLTLTGRACGLSERAPMCGVPYHAAQNYIDRLIDLGYKVAICEQQTEPNGKDLVERGVNQIVTAGTVTNESALDNKSNNFIACIYYDKSYGVAFADITTGDVYATNIEGTDNLENLLFAELARFSPSEILLSDKLSDNTLFASELKKSFSACITPISDDTYKKDSDLSNTALNGLMAYIKETQVGKAIELKKPVFYGTQQFLQLDYSTKKNLEITQNLYKNSKSKTLLSTLDKTETSFGARLLKKWLDMPLCSLEDIISRQDAVLEFYNNFMLRKEMQKALNNIQDIERIMGKVNNDRANPRDVYALGQSFANLPNVKSLLNDITCDYFSNIKSSFDSLDDICTLIKSAIIEDAPVSSKDGNLIIDGYNEYVDKYRSYNGTGSKKILEMEEKEQGLTGISKLKIGYNKIIGYYIEVPKSQKDKVPERYVGKATLTNSERYITAELQELENNILGASAKNNQLEYELFIDICDKIKANSKRIIRTTDILARLDVFQSLAEDAEINNYRKPMMTTNDDIKLTNSRHPIIEKIIGTDKFIANDVNINSEDRIAVITGPNMAGKSTYMRQVALIVIMAQIGSFVPAEEAEIGICDKIFSRIGASDNLSLGQSTFMVEMMEVSNILANATDKSLVILDEVGRGTSTYDGLAIAWSVVEDLAEVGAKTLFATHYHELIELEERIPTVKNYSVSAIRQNDELVFMHKVQDGGVDDSYGIEVAKMAGVKKSVLDRATEIVSKLESKGEVV